LPIDTPAQLARIALPTHNQHALTEIACRDVSVVFGDQRGNRSSVLNDLNLEVRRGEILTLVGPSGCGKSTLLRSIAGLQKLTKGEISLNTASNSDHPIGFVFQEANLLDWRTVWQNVRLPLELYRESKSEQSRERIRKLLEAVALRQSDYSKYPDQLSGGMKMRVALARALATSPTVMLLDEPFAALDDVLRNQLNDLLLQLWEDNSFTMIFVTHNIAEAIYLSHRIAIMHQGQIARTIDLEFPFPRNRSLRSSPQFAAMYGEISSILELQNSRA
jgi:NitT/TauT family transport system ATP-binding protein